MGRSRSAVGCSRLKNNVVLMAFVENRAMSFTDIKCFNRIEKSALNKTHETISIECEINITFNFER